MDKISSLIPKVLSKKGLKDHASASYAVFLANEWIESHMPNVSVYLHALQLKNSVLEVHSQHSIASQELMGTSKKLIDYLRSFEGITVSEVSIVKSKTANAANLLAEEE